MIEEIRQRPTKMELLSHIAIEDGIFLAVLLAPGFEAKRVVDLHSSVSSSQQEILRLQRHLAEVSNRYQLSAYFIEDLLIPLAP